MPWPRVIHGVSVCRPRREPAPEWIRVTPSISFSRRASAIAGVAALAVVAASLTVAPSATAAKPHVPKGTPTEAGQTYEAGTYIVMFQGLPATSYNGEVDGLAATRPTGNQEFRSTSPAVERYSRYLKRGHERSLARAGVSTSQRLYDYTTAFNGVAVDVSAAEATALSKDPNVAALFPNERRSLTTNTTPEFLGLTGPDGVWAGLGGDRRAGEGYVVGVVDTGVWPENPGVKFKKRYQATLPEDWKGKCQKGEDWPKDTCNSKLIGARYFDEGMGEGNIAGFDYLSPRDADGHGTHTLTTAAGSPTTATVDDVDYGTVSGMAPGAFVAAYKACWYDKAGESGCYSVDTVAAIDKAVHDGVDAINFSIGASSESTVMDPDEIAFLFAADAGIFVAASAGNEGPGASTTDHVSPWLTSVAASSTKINEKAVQLGTGERFVGASSTPTLKATPAVLAVKARKDKADKAEAKLCYPGTLDKNKVKGKVVVCDRGVIARVDKSLTVEKAGGAGMVLVNTSPDSLNGDLHFVPTVHVDEVDGAAIKDYVKSDSNPTLKFANLKPGESDTQVPEVAEFSSRGPSVTTGGDILKPDISAPGVDILAGMSPVADAGRNWDLLSGTSMASPHIAGISILIQQEHPDWSPAMIKSALQTTAMDNVTTTSPFEQGAGFVQPMPAGSPGLVYDAGWDDWLSFLVGQGLEIDGVDPIDASDLNQSTIAVGSLAGEQTVTRTVTNVGDAGTYEASVDGMPGVHVKVQPHTLTLDHGESASFDVTFTSEEDATIDDWSTGHVTWTSGETTVRSAVAVRPVGVSAPAEVSGEGTSGSVDVTVTSGFEGTMDTEAYGLAAGVSKDGEVDIDAGAFDPLNPTAGPAVKKYNVNVPDGSSALRVDLQAVDDTGDMDLYLYDSAGELVALSATGSADEQITWLGVPAGKYTAYIHGFGGTSPAEFTFTKFVVGGPGSDNLTVDPESASVEIAEDATFEFAWSDLEADTPYFGWVGYLRGDDMLGQTVVSIG